MTQRYQPPGSPQPSPRPPRNQGFWTSLPGILTASATLIASVGGLIGALFAAGVIGGSGGGDQPANVQTVPTSTTQAIAPTATTQSDVIAPVFTPVGDVQVIATATTFVPAAPQEIDINGIWASQGGFTWVISQDGSEVEISSLDFVGTSYLGTRTGNSVVINRISDGISVAAASGSMVIQSNGSVINVVINGAPDILIRQ